MHTRDLRRAILIPGLLAILSSLAFAGGESLKAGAGLPVHTKAEALEVAKAYVGPIFPSDISKEKLDEMVKQTISQDTTTPFLSDSLRGRASWVVTFPRVMLRSNRLDDGVEDAKPKDFVVWIDSISGRFLNAEFSSPDVKDTDRQQCSADEAERQLMEICGETYLGLPEELPKLTLLNALDMIEFGSPLSSKWGTFTYVLHSRRNMGVQPSWIIHLYGYEGRYSHVRYAIDANTGENRMTITLPSPGALDTTK